MCGDYQSVIGMDVNEPLRRFLHKVPRRALHAGGWSGPSLSGIAVELDDGTGLATGRGAVFAWAAFCPSPSPYFWG